MVQIRRGTAMSKASVASSSSWITWRTALLLIIGVQGLRLLYKLSNATFTGASLSLVSSSSTSLLLESQSPPLLHPEAPLSQVVRTTRAAAAAAAAGKSKKLKYNEHPQQQKQQQQQQEAMQHANTNGDGDGVHPDVHREEQATDDTDSDTDIAAAAAADAAADTTATRRGTGPVAKTGYVVDLVAERDQASFRRDSFPDAVQQLAHVTQLWRTSNDKNADHGTSSSSLSSSVSSTASWRPCVTYPRRSLSFSSDSRATYAASCTDAQTTLYAYNSAPFPRYHDCDTTTTTMVRIEPHQVVRLTACVAAEGHSDRQQQQYVRLFPHTVDHTHVRDNSKHLPTTTILSQATAVSPGSSIDAIATRTVTCPVPCAWDKTVTLSLSAGSDASGSGGALAQKQGVTPLTVKGNTDWTILHSTDDPYYNANAKIERTNFRSNVYYSTASLSSSVPLSFYDLNIYKTPEYSSHIVDWTKAADKATYLMDEECTSGRRNKWVAAVEAVMDVGAYGSCQHNTDLGPDETIDTLEGRLKLMRKNRITLVLEQGTDKDYVTSIVWEALLAGNVPAIVGAGNLERRLPPNAAIYGSNFNTWDKFAAHIRLVTTNQTLYEMHQQWRKQPAVIQAFVDTFEFTKQSPECRLCQWALAKQYGLGWNHSRQEIQSTRLPRALCHAKERVTHPFVEQWLSVAARTKGATVVSTPRRALTDINACATDGSKELNGEVSASDYKVERTVFERDGVIDIVITNVEHTPASPSTEVDDLVLRLVFDTIRNTDGAYFRDTHTLVTEATHIPIISSASLQDDAIKVSVLANWVTRLHCPGEGLLDVTIASGAIASNDEPTSDGSRPRPRRIRIIVEDMNPLHDKITEFFPSTFGRQMMHDFIDPLELYYDA